MKKPKTVLIIFIVLSSIFFFFNRGKKDKNEENKRNSIKTSLKQSLAKKNTLSKPSLPENSEAVVTEKKSEAQIVTQQTRSDFNKLEIPTKIPKDPSKKYGLLYGNFLKASFFLNEVAAQNIAPTREELAKSFKILIQYSKDYDIDDVSYVLTLIADQDNKTFKEALLELNQKDSNEVLSIMEQDPDNR